MLIAKAFASSETTQALSDIAAEAPMRVKQ